MVAYQVVRFSYKEIYCVSCACANRKSNQKISLSSFESIASGLSARIYYSNKTKYFVMHTWVVVMYVAARDLFITQSYLILLQSTMNRRNHL
jgi:hypothetical protein